jgi:hypothetical protein
VPKLSDKFTVHGASYVRLPNGVLQHSQLHSLLCEVGRFAGPHALMNGLLELDRERVGQQGWHLCSRP